MRIALVTETWLPSTDGIVTRLLATVDELLDAGHQVLVICPGPAAAIRRDGRADPRVEVRTVPTISFRFIYGGQPWGLPTPAVAGYLRQFRPDVVHVVNPLLLGIAGVVAARLSGVPLLASYHTDVAAYAGYYHLGLLRRVIWLTIRLLHNQAGINLATSATGEDQLHAHGVRNVRRWPQGVDLRLFHPAAGPRRPQHRPVALYVGRLAAEKGLDRLLPLSVPGGGFDLVLVGDGPHRAILRETLGPTAAFAGLMHGEDLAAAYRQADVFVFPSTTDTLGLVVLEALASGLPVVAVDSPASRGVLSGCPAARLVPVGDPGRLRQAAADLAALHRSDPGGTTTAARELAEHCGWGTATAFLLDCYRQLACTPDTPRGAWSRPGHRARPHR